MTNSLNQKKSAALYRLLITSICLLLPTPAVGDDAGGDELEGLSLEALLQVEVTSVSKRAQKISQAAAAITVIDSEEIRRSGMTTIPDLLRLVPGLHVASIDANKWAVTARGFNSEFTNKLLVMIDGRSVYTPLFGGTYWDSQDVVFEDIDRIEVIRGPGGTVWGANAMNGVINIITKSAKETHGAFVEAGGGSQELAFGSTRWGGAVGDDLHYRGYIKGFLRDNNQDPWDDEYYDEWDQIRAGGRSDWQMSEATSLTLQGDYYNGSSDGSVTDNPFLFPLGRPDTVDVSGWNVLARLNHSFGENHDASLQFYYDKTKRHQRIHDEDRQRIDIELQHYFEPTAWLGVTWGAGYRWDDDYFKGLTPTVRMNNPRRSSSLVSGFLQGDFAVVENLLHFIVGTKLEHNGYTGFEYQPSGRLLLTPHEDHTIWAAVSRAVRTPSRAEDDIRITLQQGPFLTVFVDGQHGVNAERLYAYELGYRTQPFDNLSFDIAGYFNDYDKLITGEEYPSNPCFPGFCPQILQLFDNKGDAFGWGVEASISWVATDWLKFIWNYSYAEVNARTDASSTDPEFNGKRYEHAEHQTSLRARVDLPWNFEFDTQVFYIGKVKSESIDAYGRLDLRLGYQPVEYVEISIAAQNLTAKNHDEWGAGNNTFASEVPRSFYGKVSVRWP